MPESVEYWCYKMAQGITYNGTTLPFGFRHVAIKVGDIWYDYPGNRPGFRASKSCNGTEKQYRLGRTDKTHEEIKKWSKDYSTKYPYAFGGTNCQKYAKDLNTYLGTTDRELPPSDKKVLGMALRKSLEALNQI